jgi:uncharacterized membrane protein
MQQMIDAIENPAFFLTFLGAPVLATAALVQARRSGSTETARWILVALGAYAVMLIVSFAVHFPLNADLESAGDPGRIRDLAAVRDDFATPWIVGNIVRTLALTVAFGSLTRALVAHGRERRSTAFALAPADRSSGGAPTRRPATGRGSDPVAHPSERPVFERAARLRFGHDDR